MFNLSVNTFNLQDIKQLSLEEEHELAISYFEYKDKEAWKKEYALRMLKMQQAKQEKKGKDNGISRTGIDTNREDHKGLENGVESPWPPRGAVSG
jgi:hypothetical protein